jgi:uncharacterized surface protein with fasciclin (FAS1) repeats
MYARPAFVQCLLKDGDSWRSFKRSSRPARRVGARGLILLGAFVSFVLSVVLSEAERGPDGGRVTKTNTIKGVEMQKNIVETARDAGTFTTLIAAIDRAGRESTLAGEGPFTVFAPSDEAFAQLPEGTVDSLLAEPDRLAEVLTYHVVPGRVTAADVVGLATAPTVQGEELRVSVDGGVHVDGARVLNADIEASNGIIRVIDRVLLPAAI